MASAASDNKRDPIEKVLADYDAKKDTLAQFCVRTQGLIEACLEDAKLRYQSIQWRVKRKQKLEDKYLDPKRNYSKLEDITDLAALRIITYYEDEVDQTAEVIRKEFTVIPEKSIDKRETAPDKFGYYAFNLVCTHTGQRRADVQFKKYGNLEFEIQITSVLRHAWSEIEHEWYDLKDDYPAEIKRKFYLLAALLEIAESDFKSLRDRKQRYVRSVEVRVEANVPDVPIDAVSLKKLITSEPIVAQLDKAIAAIMEYPLVEASDQLIEIRAQIAKAAGFARITDLVESLRKYSAAIPEYITRCKQYWPRAAGTKMGSGICINHLALLLLGAQGLDNFMKTLQELNYAVSYDLKPQVAIAAEILAKYR